MEGHTIYLYECKAVQILSKCNGTSCMLFPFQVLSLAMVHFLQSLSHILRVVVFWREVVTFFDLPKPVAIEWDSHL
jgi:hypothetical protein